MNTATTEPAEDPDTIFVTSIDDFATHIAAWHEVKVKLLKHLLRVPEGATFKIGEDELALTGNAHKAFKLGIELAILQIQELPFDVDRPTNESHLQ
jgi:hypothetical protein